MFGECQTLFLGFESLIDYRIPLPRRLGATLFRTILTTIFFHHVLIGLHRAHAIMFPYQYNNFWTFKSNLIIILFIWITPFTYNYTSFYHMGMREEDIYHHCVREMSYCVENPTSESFLFHRNVTRMVFSILLATAFAFYLLVVMKIAMDKVLRGKKYTEALFNCNFIKHW